MQSRFVFVCRSNVLYVENIFICWFLCEIYVLYYDIYFVYDHTYNNSEKI